MKETIKELISKVIYLKVFNFPLGLNLENEIKSQHSLFIVNVKLGCSFCAIKDDFCC